MSDKLGPLLYAENEEEVFLGHSVARQQQVAETTQQVVDAEVKGFVNDGYETANSLLKSHIDQLHTIAKGLLEYETLTGDEIRDLLNGKPPVRETMDDDTPKGPRVATVPSTGGSREKDDRGGEPGGLEPQPQG